MAGPDGAGDGAVRRPGPDEDLVTMPAGWLQVLHPRRGGAPGPALPDPAGGPAAAAAALAPLRAAIEAGLDTDPDLAAAGRGYLDALLAGRTGDASTPLGAAAVAVAASEQLGQDAAAAYTALADAWVVTRGVPFAAAAVAGCAGIVAQPQWPPERRPGRARFRLRAADEISGLQQRTWRPLAERVRARLAGASDAEYREAVAGLTAHRSAVLRVQVVVCYLAPTDADRVDEVCRTAARTEWEWPAADLLCAVSSAGQLDRLIGLASTPLLAEPATLATLLDGVGAALAPHLAAWCDRGDLDADGRKRLLDGLVAIPTDRAFGLLVERLDRRDGPAAVRAALRRYPVRGLRLLAAAAADDAGGGLAAVLLADHAADHPDLAAAVPDVRLPAGADPAAPVPAAPVPAAPPDRLPAVLVDPPWTRRRSRAAPVVVEGLTAPAGSRAVWRPGERAAWASRPPLPDARYDPASWPEVQPHEHHGTWAEAEVRYRAGRTATPEEGAFLVDAPDQLARPLLAQWRPDNYWACHDALKAIMARYELDALPSVLHLAGQNPGKPLGHLMPFAGPEVAALMAAALVRFKPIRRVAAQWLLRHPAAAAQALVPAALSDPGPDRVAADAALRLIAAAGHRQDVLAAAAGYGGPAAAGVEALLAAGLAVLPARTPRLPAWLDPAVLPPVLLRGRDEALPAEAVRHFCTMLAISEPGSMYAGVGLVTDACDPGSVAGFGWALFERWRLAGLPTADGWVLAALARLGDDDTVRRLAPLIRIWPGDGGHSWAVAGLDVLAGIGTEAALRQLCDISAKVPFKALRDRAREKVAEVAAELWLGPDQLADRLVPDLGLGPDGMLTLDYGSRRFHVGVDEELRAYAVTQDGTRRKDLPKPARTDDTALATASYRRFAGLRKDARRVGAEQADRLEQAMVASRRWTAAEFRDLFVTHPLMRHLVRRLVWASYDAGAPLAALRVAGDSSLTGLGGEPVTLDPAATVGVVHPVQLGADVAAWAERFAADGIGQPFPQLHREAYALTGAERAASNLDRFTGRTVPTSGILDLCRGRWQAGTHVSAHHLTSMELTAPGDLLVAVELGHGIPFDPDQHVEEDTLTAIHLVSPLAGGPPGRTTLPFGELDPVTASEVLRDLTRLTAARAEIAGRS